MTILWWPRAMLALLNMPIADATAVDSAVQHWAATGAGIVHSAEGGVFLLYVGVYVVEFFVDHDTLHVDSVRRA